MEKLDILVLQSGRCHLSEKKSKRFIQHLIDGAWSKNGDKLFLEFAFMPLPGIVDKSEFTLDYLLQLAIVICLYGSMEKQVFATFSLFL